MATVVALQSMLKMPLGCSMVEVITQESTVVVGCMTPSAENFDPAANQDSGECAFAAVATGEVTVEGCMVQSALVNTRNSP